MPYLPYEEPGITTILSLTSFLLLLNGSRCIFDRLLYSGIIGEILIGIIWGLPVGGTAWLTEEMQETIQAFGYLGLIGLVFEGGLSTDISLLRKNACVSVSIATVGLLMPIAFSFLLLVFPFSSGNGGTAYPTPLAAFSAGASLCSTSLGTTFAILSSANLQKTRIGVVLVGAAMMDDVVGLVMVNIITTLGHGGSGGWSIARPIAASFGMLLLTLIFCPYVLRPAWSYSLRLLRSDVEVDAPPASTSSLWSLTAQAVHSIPYLGFVLSTLVLIVFVTIASFIDASVLFAAFIAGGAVSFLWNSPTDQSSESGPMKMYEEYYKPAMDYILVPFLFASIGFSIPLTDMFAGAIVWKGIVYSIFMVIAKMMVSCVIYTEYHLTHRPMFRRGRKNSSHRIGGAEGGLHMQSPPNASDAATEQLQHGPPHSTASLVGLAMVARGEIGFLIASLSQSSGTLMLKERNNVEPESYGEEIFLVIIWSVVVCTIVGPLGVGIIVRRLKNRS